MWRSSPDPGCPHPRRCSFPQRDHFASRFRNFFAQAVATWFVGRAATRDRGSAGGLYLASYFLGGLAGSFVLGQVFDRVGWPACVAGIGAALALAALLALRLAHGRAMEKHPWHTGQRCRSTAGLPG